MTEVFNPIEVRYATGELAQCYFVKWQDHEAVVAERDYWHHMYNQATAPDNIPLEFSLVEDVVPV